MTEVIGLVVVIVAAFAFWPLLFGNRPEPATQPAGTTRGPSPRVENRTQTTDHRPVVERHRGEPTRLRVSALVRLRGVVGLVFLCAGVAALIAVAVGSVVFFLGIKLQG